MDSKLPCSAQSPPLLPITVTENIHYITINLGEMGRMSPTAKAPGLFTEGPTKNGTPGENKRAKKKKRRKKGCGLGEGENWFFSEHAIYIVLTAIWTSKQQ